MSYALFRLSVVPRMQISLFHEGSNVEDDSAAEQAKEKYLRDTFSRVRHFTHFGRQYVFQSLFSLSEYIGGFIARSAETPVRSGPGTRATLTPDWPHCNVILNFDRSHGHQLIAVEINRRVGRPWPVLRSFIDDVNERSFDATFDIIAVPLANQQDYLNAAKKYKGHITEVRFEFVVPNIKFMPSSLREDLAEGRDQFNAQVMELGVTNAKGYVKADAPALVALAKEAEKGIGTIIMKWLRKVIYRSDNKIKTIDTANKASIVDIEPKDFAKTAKELFSQWEQ